MTDISNSDMGVAEIARGYLRCSAALSSQSEDTDAIWNPETDADQRAYDLVASAIRRGSAVHAWQLVLAVLDQAADDRLAFEAVGPLEDLVRFRGAEVVEFIEAAAARDERFKWALGHIWIRASNLPPKAVNRIVAASGNKIQPI